MHAHPFDQQKLATVCRTGCRNTQLLTYYFEIGKNILESKLRKIWYILLLVIFSGGKEGERIFIAALLKRAKKPKNINVHQMEDK